MAEKKEYKNGSKRYVIGVDGYKRKRKSVQKYNTEFKAKTYQRVVVLVRKDNEEVIKKLESVESKSNYILGLIEKDIKASKN